MKILFVTGAYPKGSEDLLLHLGKGTPLSIQANTFQWAVIDGLEKNQADYSVVSYPYISCFPFHFRKLYTPQLDFIHNGRNIGTMESHFNVSLMTRRPVKNGLYKYIDNWAKKQQGYDTLIVLTYTPASVFLEPVIKLKRKYPNISLCTIITDLPEDNASGLFNMKWHRRLILKKELKRIHKCYKAVDKFVLLSKPMEEYVNEAIGNNIIIEGLCAECNGFTPKMCKSKLLTLLYTGSLGEHTNITDLIDAFLKTTNKDFRLVICGGGSNEHYIRERASQDQRIIYKGVVPRSEVLRLQKEATAVINPRKPSIPLTPYSFPSKTMEYMSSGTPLIGYKLKGIPEEYYQHYYALDSESQDVLTNAINEILTKPIEELNYMALSAYNFICQNKTSYHQINRLLRFLSYR